MLLEYNPLYMLYRKGPFINGFGFWSGKENPEICSQLTNMDSIHWINNDYECIKLIHRHYESFEIVVYITFIIIFMFKLFSHIFTYFIYIRPITQVIEKTRQTSHKQLN